MNTSRELWLVTWLHESPFDEWGRYSQVHGKSSTTAVRDVYRRAACIFFHCARLFAPQARLALVTNSSLSAKIDGVSMSDLLADLGVTVERRGYDAKPPPGWSRTWSNQFYVIDAIDAMGQHVAPSDSLALLDSDCIVTGSLNALQRDIDLHGSQAYVLPFPSHHVENGLSLNDLRKLAAELGWRSPIGYCGGEFIALRGDQLERYVRLMNHCWLDAQIRFASGRIHAREEAHVWSLVAAEMQANPNGNRHVRRIWTGLQHRDVRSQDERLAIWHVPSEKTTGMRRFWERNTRKIATDGLGNPSVVRDELSRLLGVPKVSATKTASDVFMRLRHRSDLAVGAVRRRPTIQG